MKSPPPFGGISIFSTSTAKIGARSKWKSRAFYLGKIGAGNEFASQIRSSDQQSPKVAVAESFQEFLEGEMRKTNGGRKSTGGKSPETRHTVSNGPPFPLALFLGLHHRTESEERANDSE